MATPHDALFKHTFSQPEHAVWLLRTILPAQLVAAIDWRTLRAADGSLVDAELREHHTDLLFTVRVAGRRALLFVLVEHKSDTVHFTALQMLRYVVTIWHRYHIDHPEARNLPPIVPVVVHHGEHGWSAPTELRDLIDLSALDPALARVLDRFLPEFRFLLHDLVLRSEVELRSLVASSLVRVTLLCLQHIRDNDAMAAEAAISRWATLVGGLLAAPGGRDAADTLWSYVLSVTDLSVERLRTVVAREVGRDAEETVMSTADKIAKEAHDRGLVEGEAKGEARGEARGEAKGQAKLLLQLLAARFGPVAEAMENRVRSATLPDLARWAERVLFAQTIEQVFAESAPDPE